MRFLCFIWLEWLVPILHDFLLCSFGIDLISLDLLKWFHCFYPLMKSSNQGSWMKGQTWYLWWVWQLKVPNSFLRCGAMASVKRCQIYSGGYRSVVLGCYRQVSRLSCKNLSYQHLRSVVSVNPTVHQVVWSLKRATRYLSSGGGREVFERNAPGFQSLVNAKWCFFCRRSKKRRLGRVSSGCRALFPPMSMKQYVGIHESFQFTPQFLSLSYNTLSGKWDAKWNWPWKRQKKVVDG